MTDYALDIDGDEFQPIPESWLDHPSAVDVREGESEHRLYAVSVSVASPRMLRLRYAHPISFEVLRFTVGACKAPDGEGYVPAGLEAAGDTWARSLPPVADPMDVLRAPEIEHFHTLWADRLGLSGDRDQPAISDGGGDALIGITWNRPAPHPDGCECSWCLEAESDHDGGSR